MDDFSTVKVGDRLWSSLCGWGVVIDTCRMPIIIRSELTNDIHSFTKDGKFYINGLQCLFWDEVKIVPPPKPKEKVILVMEHLKWYECSCGYIYPSPSPLKGHDVDYLLGKPPMKITLEWEE